MNNRWKKNDKGDVEHDPVTKKPILQFVAIQRGDTSEWAIPGVSQTSLYIYIYHNNQLTKIEFKKGYVRPG